MFIYSKGIVVRVLKVIFYFSIYGLRRLVTSVGLLCTPYFQVCRIRD